MTIVRQTKALVTCMLGWRGNDSRCRWTKRSTFEFQQTLNTFQAWLFRDENRQTTLPEDNSRPGFVSAPRFIQSRNGADFSFESPAIVRVGCLIVLLVRNIGSMDLFMGRS